MILNFFQIVFIFSYFNELLEDIQECAKMKLAFVEAVYLYETPQKYDNKVFEKSVQVTFKAQPGEGYFEATLGIESKSKDDDEKFVIIGEVFRINKYGHQADCLPRIKLAKMPILKGICYCD